MVMEARTNATFTQGQNSLGHVSRSRADGPRLPQELMDIIISLLHSDKKTLSSISLASYSLAPLARSFIFHSITLVPDQDKETSVEFFAKSPTLCQMIKELTIAPSNRWTVYSTSWPFSVLPMLPNVQVLVMSRCDLWLEGTSPMLHPHVLSGLHLIDIRAAPRHITKLFHLFSLSKVLEITRLGLFSTHPSQGSDGPPCLPQQCPSQVRLKGWGAYKVLHDTQDMEMSRLSDFGIDVTAEWSNPLRGVHALCGFLLKHGIGLRTLRIILHEIILSNYDNGE